MKKLVGILLGCLISFCAVAQNNRDFFNQTDSEFPEDQRLAPDSAQIASTDSVPHQRVAWRWMHKGVYRKILPMDTLTDGIHNYNLIFKHSISNNYLGNFPAPYESNIFIDRVDNESFLPFQAARAYMLRPDDMQEYSTTTPYTRLSYYTGGSQQKGENFLEVWHMQNLKPWWNAGFTYQLISGLGVYNYQKSKTYHFSGFSSYEKERLAFSVFVNQNVGHFKENGGVADTYDIRNRDTTMLSPEMVAVQLNYEPRSNYRNFNLQLTGQYNIGREKETFYSVGSDGQDSIFTYTYPVKAAFSLLVEDNAHWFDESTVETDYFEESHISTTSNRDLYTQRVFEADAKLILNEHPRFRYLPGVYAGLSLRNHRYKQALELVEQSGEGEEENDSPEYTLRRGTHSVSNTWLTAGIYNVDTAAVFQFDAWGEFCLVGDNIADFSLQGELTQHLRRGRQTYIRAKAKLESLSPNPFYTFYFGNHDAWQNNFDRTTCYDVQGSFHSTRLRTEIGAGIRGIDGYIYLDTIAQPVQNSGNMMVFTAWVKQVFRLGSFYFDQRVYWQHSGNKEVLSVPMISLYSHNYYQARWVQGILGVQAGIDLFYNTGFYARAYRPSIMQFHNQRVEQTGNYPKMDAFVSFNLKRADIFLKLEHFSIYLADRNYFSALYYPINPMQFKFGVRWNFFD